MSIVSYYDIQFLNVYRRHRPWMFQSVRKCLYLESNNNYLGITKRYEATIFWIRRHIKSEVMRTY